MISQLNSINKKITNTKLLVAFSLLLVVFSILPKVAGAEEASFYLSPANGNYRVGETFSVTLFINAQGVSINASQAKIIFPAEKLKVIDVSKSGSIFTLWAQEPVFSNEKGEISFGGGLPSPGYIGEAGKVITIFFQGKFEGETLVNLEKEIITANDPRGTNVFSFSRGGIYSIFPPEKIPPKVIPEKVPAAPKVSSITHPDGTKWYNNNSPKLQWELTPDIIGVSTALNQKPIFDPASLSQGLFDSISFEGIEDGIWYFHIKLQNKVGWGGITHFKVQIDTQAPHSFEITLDNEGDPANPQPLLYFETKDDTSGISHYEIKIGVGDTFKVFEVETNPFRLPHQAPGTHPILVRAVDMAENYTESMTQIKVESIEAPKITICPDTFISGEEVLHIEGIALPNHTIISFFKTDEKLIKTWEVFSSEIGDWSFEEDGLFKSGIYKISARAKNVKGAISHSSEECKVRVILAGIAIGPWIVSYRNLILVSIIILVFVLFLIFYLFWRSRRTRRIIKREAQDLKQKFYKEYKELQDDILKELEILKKARGEREITEEEKKREAELLKNLDDIKRVLEKELKDIEEM